MPLAIFVLLISCQFSNTKKSQEEPKLITVENQENSASRSVSDNLLRSKGLPEIQLKVADEFKFIGNFEFEIIASSNEYPAEMIGKAVAAGERFVFAAVNSEHEIEKLFVVQFEGFLATNNFIYNYNFDKAEIIGANKYRHNTWFYNAKESAKENPEGEGAKTQGFLEEKGLKLADELMMSRFVGLASGDRKNEIIIYYFEVLNKTTGFSLDEWENSLSREAKVKIDSAFVARSKKSFKIIEG
ncbi:MAG: hypothetical protein ACR2MT_09690 [Aurantibacter sp.]